jgi:hypothetical protein
LENARHDAASEEAHVAAQDRHRRTEDDQFDAEVVSHGYAQSLEKLLQNLRTPLVGKDGSGGATSEKLVDSAHCGTQPKHKPGLKREGGCRRRGYRRK